jgi:hypothetical protein
MTPVKPHILAAADAAGNAVGLSTVLPLSVTIQ